VYIDGFNLYYGACRRADRKWLDVEALCARLLPNDELGEIAYCTATIKKDVSNPEKQDRQRLYLGALRTLPRVRIHLGRFVVRRVSGNLVVPCPTEPTKAVVETFEEKGTDVNIASLLLKDGYENRYDSAVVISNDGDLKMPIQIVRSDLNKIVTVINPILNPTKVRSAALSPNPLPANARFIQMRPVDLETSQFPNELRSRKGGRLVKPAAW
jgi:uncharacterized LabA/DUF88 family protein